MSTGTATREGEGTVAKTVVMQIEYRDNVKHLHLTKETKLELTLGEQVDWTVQILPKKETERIPDDFRANEVRVWSPMPAELFVYKGEPRREIVIGPFTYSDVDNKGTASVQFTVNREFTVDPKFPLEAKTAIPIAIYTDIDEGQNEDVKHPRKGNFSQPGRQMVDGAHSHPECEVGP